MYDTSKFINSAQVGGIESYCIDDGAGRGVRSLWVNTGGGLRYRVLVDRGLDIDQAFFNAASLTFLSHKGVTPPTRSLDRRLDWLKGFPVGLLTSCGPWNIGGPNVDQGEELGLHGPHSNTSATIESIIQPDPHQGRTEMTIVGRLRYGAFYGPCVELKRTITSRLGENRIEVMDEFSNAANTEVPHAWLLHINLGYPLVDGGAEFCYCEERVEPIPGHEGAARVFRAGGGYKRVPEPMKEHSGPESWVGYLYPKAAADGMARVGIINRKLGLGLAIDYNTKEFDRCANWQHWGTYEYVTALEPMYGGTVEGRDKDRARGWVKTLAPGARRAYHYSISVVSDKAGLDSLEELNRR